MSEIIIPHGLPTRPIRRQVLPETQAATSDVQAESELFHTLSNIGMSWFHMLKEHEAADQMAEAQARTNQALMQYDQFIRDHPDMPDTNLKGFQSILKDHEADMDRFLTNTKAKRGFQQWYSNSKTQAADAAIKKAAEIRLKTERAKFGANLNAILTQPASDMDEIRFSEQLGEIRDIVHSAYARNILNIAQDGEPEEIIVEAQKDLLFDYAEKELSDLPYEDFQKAVKRKPDIIAEYEKENQIDLSKEWYGRARDLERKIEWEREKSNEAEELRMEESRRVLNRLYATDRLTQEAIFEAQLPAKEEKQWLEDLMKMDPDEDDFDAKRAIEDATDEYGMGYISRSDVDDLFTENKGKLTKTTRKSLHSALEGEKDSARSYHRQAGWRTLEAMLYSGKDALGNLIWKNESEKNQYSRARTLWEIEVDGQSRSGKFLDPEQRYKRLRTIAREIRSQVQSEPIIEITDPTLRKLMQETDIPPLRPTKGESDSDKKRRWTFHEEMLKETGESQEDIEKAKKSFFWNPALDPLVTAEENSRQLKADEKEWLSIHLQELRDIWHDLPESEKKKVIDAILANPDNQTIGKQIHAHFTQ